MIDTLPPRRFSEQGGTYAISLNELSTELTARVVRDEPGALRAAVSVACGLDSAITRDGYLASVTIALDSLRDRELLAAYLARRANAPELDAMVWSDLLDDLLRHIVAERHPEHSPERGETSERKQLNFQTARQFAAKVPSEIAWLWTAWIACGSLVELVGKAKAAGKTTFLGHLIRAVVDGRPFLGFATMRTPVVILTEQSGASLRAVLDRAELADRGDIVLLTWSDARGVPWEELVDAAVAECRRIGASLLIVDTLPAFAGIAGDAENDAGAALTTIAPLQAAAADGLAVIVVRHERKGGGEVGDSARGSSAYTGAVEVVLRLGRQENPARPTIRMLSSLSRFDETPAELVIELTDDGYVSLGDETAVAFAEARRAVLKVLPESPADGLPEPVVVERTGGRATTVGSALRALQDAGDVERTGLGRRGSPYLWRRVSNDPDLLSPALRSKSGERKQIGPYRRTSNVAEELASIFDDGEGEA